jgi:hypothetical protein
VSKIAVVIVIGAEVRYDLVGCRRGSDMLYAILGFVLLTGLASLRSLCAHQPADRRYRTILQYLFLVRFQLLFFLVIAVFPVLALEGSPALLGNILAFDNSLDIFAVALSACLVAWLCGLSVTIVAKRAAERIDGLHPLKAPGWLRYKSALFTLPALPIYTAVFTQSETETASWAALAVAAIALNWIHSDSRQAPSQSTSISPQHNLQRRGPPGRVIQAISNGRRWLLRRLGPGYVDAAGNIYKDHRQLAFVAVVGLVPGYFMGRNSFGFESRTNFIVAFIYLEFLLFAITYILSQMSFFLDRFRIPVLLCFVAWSIAAWGAFGSDHYFSIFASSAEQSRPLDAEGAIENWLTRREADGVKPILVVVSASGGGIQAAAWTARVLTGLSQQLGNRFEVSIRLISSVSGGSVGAMYFTESWFQHGREHGGAPPGGEAGDLVLRAASLSSLDGTAWGIMYPDLARVFFPMFVPPDLDRGWAIEQAWRAALLALPAVKSPQSFDEALQDTIQNYRQVFGGRLPLGSRLSDWRAGVAAGWLPGTIFNATTIELGTPMLLATVDVPGSDGFVFGSKTGQYDGADISVVTAARLSASFPYVSPAATACYKASISQSGCLEGLDQPPTSLHVADGGYYDNFGFDSATSWLRSVLDRYQNRLAHVLIIQILAFPETPDDGNQRSGSPWSRFDGWLNQLVGPAATLLSTRTKLQREANRRELDFFKKQYSNEFIKTAVFQAFREGPLSWHLSERQKRDIECDWHDHRTQREVMRIAEMFDVALHDVATECKTRKQN